MSTTEGTLLGGRISYRQPLVGHRSGIEPVLLAAAIPARPGDLVLEAGTGAGAALLCLAGRVRGIGGIGVEIDPILARIAADNFCANGFDELRVVAGDITRPPFAGRFAHVLANPPWHEAAGTASPDPGRRLAHRAPDSLLSRWIGALSHLLRPRGTITLILPAASLGAAIAALADRGCGARHILPLWPREGRAAKLLIIQSRKSAQGPDALLPGLVLHGEGAKYTEAAERILRSGEPLIR